jgi:hypothetical protein
MTPKFKFKKGQEVEIVNDDRGYGIGSIGFIIMVDIVDATVPYYVQITKPSKILLSEYPDGYPNRMWFCPGDLKAVTYYREEIHEIIGYDS